MTNKARARRGFTLAELLVAVSLVALISVAIGSIFTGIQGVVSKGIATAEIDQMARALERQMRDDFDAFNRMRSDETFLAIRMREVGDWDRNGTLQPQDEVALYLTRDDQEADQLAIVGGSVTGPYGENSRAVTRRVDEIMFIAPASNGSAHFSAQIDSRRDDIEPNGRKFVEAVGAQHALIYYGHGLRPAPDPNVPEDEDAIPVRQYFADGDFGQGPGQPAMQNQENRFDLGVSQFATGRNEYAADWPLARRALLLVSCGVSEPERDQRETAQIGNGREYVLYPRDYENLQVFPELLDVIDETDLEEDAFLTPAGQGESWPGLRLLGWGRADICNMDATDLRRWLEGEPANSAYTFGGSTTAASQPFSCPGWSSLTNPVAPPEAQASLWKRDNTASVAETNNWESLRSAIAGCFARPLVETEPPRIDRRTGLSGRQPDDALMDLSAVLASNCSNFEIAWSDGSTCVDSIDPDSDAENGLLYETGDIIWYDISSYDPGDPEKRATAGEWARSREQINFILHREDYDRVEIEGQEGSDIFQRLNVASGFAPASFQPDEVYYNPDITGGIDYTTGQEEYFAIFPFRGANGGSGIDTEAFPKDILIRIRVTLHDSQNRLPEGKTFEFIFKLNPRGQ